MYLVANRLVIREWELPLSGNSSYFPIEPTFPLSMHTHIHVRQSAKFLIEYSLLYCVCMLLLCTMVEDGMFGAWFKAIMAYISPILKKFYNVSYPCMHGCTQQLWNDKYLVKNDYTRKQTIKSIVASSKGTIQLYNNTMLFIPLYQPCHHRILSTDNLYNPGDLFILSPLNE